MYIYIYIYTGVSQIGFSKNGWFFCCCFLFRYQSRRGPETPIYVYVYMCVYLRAGWAKRTACESSTHPVLLPAGWPLLAQVKSSLLEASEAAGIESCLALQIGSQKARGRLLTTRQMHDGSRRSRNIGLSLSLSHFLRNRKTTFFRGPGEKNNVRHLRQNSLNDAITNSSEATAMGPDPCSHACLGFTMVPSLAMVNWPWDRGSPGGIRFMEPDVSVSGILSLDLKEIHNETPAI